MGLIDIRRNPSKRELRWFGLLLLAFFSLMGGLALWRLGAMSVSVSIWAVGGVLACLFFAVPSLRLPLFLGWMHAAYPIGWVVSHLVLAIVYFLVVTPIGWTMRVAGRDPLLRRIHREARSYWTPHDPGASRERYFRQF